MNWFIFNANEFKITENWLFFFFCFYRKFWNISIDNLDNTTPWMGYSMKWILVFVEMSSNNFVFQKKKFKILWNLKRKINSQLLLKEKQNVSQKLIKIKNTSQQKFKCFELNHFGSLKNKTTKFFMLMKMVQEAVQNQQKKWISEKKL